MVDRRSFLFAAIPMVASVPLLALENRKFPLYCRLEHFTVEGQIINGNYYETVWAIDRYDGKFYRSTARGGFKRPQQEVLEDFKPQLIDYWWAMQRELHNA